MRRFAQVLADAPRAPTLPAVPRPGAPPAIVAVAQRRADPRQARDTPGAGKFGRGCAAIG
jgi:hypothetical protein